MPSGNIYRYKQYTWSLTASDRQGRMVRLPSASTRHAHCSINQNCLLRYEILSETKNETILLIKRLECQSGMLIEEENKLDS